MGMVCVFSTISDASIDLVRRHPVLLWKLFCSEEEFGEFAEEYNSAKRGFFAKLFGRKPTPLPDWEPNGDEGLQSDLDKAWHAIHFMLTGLADGGREPLNFIGAGGELIKGCEIGYGPGRVFTSAQVKDIDAALQAISKEEFESRYDPVKMMEADIYPNIWDRNEEEDDLLEYVSDNFVRLKQYIHTIAGKGMGMVVGLS